MPDSASSKKADVKKVLTLIALTGATVSAFYAGNYMSGVGIAYYVICAAAVLFNYRGAAWLLWGAVGAHAVLAGYGLWNWQTAQVAPCSYCFGAAGFALLAASVYTRPLAALAPVFLIAVTWYAWLYVFADKGQDDVIQQQTQKVTTEQQTENRPADVHPVPAGEIAKEGQGSQAGAVAQSEIPQEQTGVSDQAANPASQQGSTPASNDPDDKPGDGTAEQPPAPDMPGSS